MKNNSEDLTLCATGKITHTLYEMSMLYRPTVVCEQTDLKHHLFETCEQKIINIDNY